MIDDSPRMFLKRVRDVLLRIVVLVMFSTIHWLIVRGAYLLVPSQLNAYRDLLSSMDYIFFAIIYVYLLWDMLRVFLPNSFQRSDAEPEKPRYSVAK